MAYFMVRKYTGKQQCEWMLPMPYRHQKNPFVYLKKSNFKGELNRR